MPIFAGLISSAVAWFVVWFGARLGTKLSLLAGVLAVGLAGFVAAKAAVFALVGALSFIAPPVIVQAMSYALPTNLAVCLGAIFISDAIFEAYGYWRWALNATHMSLSNA